MTAETDTLVKPDMVAVLQRTHVSKDLHGFLLPTLEAVSNAMHGIEARFGDDARKQGTIEIAMSSINDPRHLMISITDNGIGLDDGNYRSFKTPFSGHKLQQNGRGFGRFIAFKVFNRILYSSRFEALPAPDKRTFRFDIHQKDELIYHDGEPDFAHLGLRVSPVPNGTSSSPLSTRVISPTTSAATSCRISSTAGCPRSRSDSTTPSPAASPLTSRTSSSSRSRAPSMSTSTVRRRGSTTR